MCGIHLHLSPSPSSLQSDRDLSHDLSHDLSLLNQRGPSYQSTKTFNLPTTPLSNVTLSAAVLHIRGDKICEQPIISTSSKSFQTGWCWNGECYNLSDFQSSSGSTLNSTSDTKVILDSVAATGLHETLNKVRGEYSFIHVNKKSVNFGRDALGRRSLTCNLDLSPLLDDVSTFDCSSSLSLDASDLTVSSIGGLYEVPSGWVWECFCTLEEGGRGVVRVRRGRRIKGGVEEGRSWDGVELRSVLSTSILLRCSTVPPPSPGIGPDGLPHSSVGVLFSGGVDCGVVAMMAGEVVDGTIDLITVSFGMDSMDRIAAIKGYELLSSLRPNKYRLIIVDASSTSAADIPIVKGLVKPRSTNMDYNIGLAFWKASKGEGGIYDGKGGRGEVRKHGDGWVTKGDGMGVNLYRRKEKCQGCGVRDVKEKDRGCYLGPRTCEVCCKKIGRVVCGGLGERRGVCGVHKVKGVEPVLPSRAGGGAGEEVTWELIKELDAMGLLVYVGIFGDFKSLNSESEREGWTSDPDLHVTVVHKSRLEKAKVRGVLKLGKVRVMVGGIRENDEFKVGRVYLKGREDLGKVASATSQTLHVTLRKREDCEARRSVELLKEGDNPPTGGDASTASENFKCVDCYIGVCLELPDGIRVVCKDFEEIDRARAAGGFKRYTSRAKALLTGHGADEQMGGYGRHRTRFISGGNDAVREELDMEMARIWTRNMGRDDRCIGGRGKEGRYPFLDEEVVEYLRYMRHKDIKEVCDFTLPQGVGDKLILRKLAEELGLVGMKDMVKRAVQFGSRSAKSRGRGKEKMEG